jgi:hypothetical protein
MRGVSLASPQLRTVDQGDQRRSFDGLLEVEVERRVETHRIPVSCE